MYKKEKKKSRKRETKWEKLHLVKEAYNPVIIDVLLNLI